MKSLMPVLFGYRLIKIIVLRVSYDFLKSGKTYEFLEIDINSPNEFEITRDSLE